MDGCSNKYPDHTIVDVRKKDTDYILHDEGKNGSDSMTAVSAQSSVSKSDNTVKQDQSVNYPKEIHIGPGDHKDNSIIHDSGHFDRCEHSAECVPFGDHGYLGAEIAFRPNLFLSPHLICCVSYSISFH